MTDVLVKMFVKNRDDIKDGKVRLAYGILASVVGILCNVLLFGIKLAVGMVINSVSVMADAFNNLSDAASSVIGFAGAKLAQKPANEEHPFGHGRYEYIAAFVVAFLVLQVGFSCLQSAIDKIRNPEQVTFSPVLIGILVASILVKLWLGLFNRKLGKRIDSTVMKATATDAFGDTLITTVTVVSIFIGKFTGLCVDGYMGLLVSLFVLYAGIGIIKETLKPLLGEAAAKEVYEEVTAYVEGYEGILGTHDLIVHNYGPANTMASIHAEVPSDCDIMKAHELIDKIEARAKHDLQLFLVIHMDPLDVVDEHVVKYREMVSNVVTNIEPEASIHDFRIVNGENRVNLIFDLVAPHTYKDEKKNELLHKIREDIHTKDEKCQCVINVEHSFVSREQS